VPQAVKIFRTRQTEDLSPPMWILQVMGFAPWVTYGATSQNWPLIVPNAICFLLACFILGMKILH